MWRSSCPSNQPGRSVGTSAGRQTSNAGSHPWRTHHRSAVTTGSSLPTARGAAGPDDSRTAREAGRAGVRMSASMSHWSGLLLGAALAFYLMGVVASVSVLLTRRTDRVFLIPAFTLGGFLVHCVGLIARGVEG